MEQQNLTLPLHPAVLVIDADEARGQRVATTLTLADFHAVVTTSPYQALERALREPLLPFVIGLGQGDWQSRATDFAMRRLFSHLAGQATQTIPTLYLSGAPRPAGPGSAPRPSYPPTGSAPSLSSYPSYPSSYPSFPSQPPSQPSRPSLPSLPSQPNMAPLPPASEPLAPHTEGAHLLEQIWRLAPATRKDMRPTAETLVNSLLPAYGLTPRIAQHLLSSNDHCRQIIEAAYQVIGAPRWAEAMTDVGLARFSHADGWPPEDDERAIPAITFSLLNAAVEQSWPANPAEQLRRWSDLGTAASLAHHSASWVTQQVIKRLPHERALGLALSGFTAEMNKTRGEELHFWKPRGDGAFWLVHYSNLYTYGRIRRNEASCVVWLASIEATLQLAQVDSVYEVSEVECSCQTLSGHCVFLIEPRLARPQS